MGKCPKCESTIPFLEQVKCSQVTPIACPQCRVKLVFNQQEFGKLLIPSLTILGINICLVVVVMHPSFKLYVLELSTFVANVLLLAGFLFILQLIRFVKSTQLEIKK